jgi:hypothetical protein
MLFILRQLRRLELRKRSGRYFLYAIGEIVLVVVGILVALQINNWNEERKLADVETELLRGLLADLNQTAENLDEGIAFNQFTELKYREILDALDDENVDETQLEGAFGQIDNWAALYPTTSAYASLKAKGIDIIQNSKLRNAIVELYENEFVFLLEDTDRSEWSIHDSVKMPFFAKHFEVRTPEEGIVLWEFSNDTATANDFQSLRTNQEFINLLSLMVRMRATNLAFSKATQVKLTQVIESIEQELGGRS